MNASDIISIVTVFVAIIGVVLVLKQINLARISIQTDYIRRKKESTFNAYNLIREDFRKLNREILNDLNIQRDGKIEKDLINKIHENCELRDKLATLLSYIERIGTGVKHDIYDIQLLNDLSGTAFIRSFDIYYPYIRESKKDSITFYRESENFIKKLREIRENRISEIESKQTQE